MDWASVVSIAITGIVGIAGVAGAIVSARMASKLATRDLQLSINAENDRANKSEKRRIYAAFQASAESMLRARINDATAVSYQKAQAKIELDKADSQMYLMSNELSLLAPESVSDPAFDMVAHFNDDTYQQKPWMDKFSRLQQRSIDTMRADLGEPVGSVEE
jgi:hypothetical protein